MRYLEGDIVNGTKVLSGPFRLFPKSFNASHYLTACRVCGKERIQQSAAVPKGQGCRYCQNRTHGLTTGAGKHPLYETWTGMRSRCQRPADTNYQYYGAKGIRVCERWSSFTNFLEDMGDRPTPNHSIDRIDGTKGYEPGNCRWASPQLQQRNLRTNRIYYYWDRGWNIDELASHAGLKKEALFSRINYLGWSIEKAVETPLKRVLRSKS